MLKIYGWKKICRGWFKQPRKCSDPFNNLVGLFQERPSDLLCNIKSIEFSDDFAQFRGGLGWINQQDRVDFASH